MPDSITIHMPAIPQRRLSSESKAGSVPEPALPGTPAEITPLRVEAGPAPGAVQPATGATQDDGCPTRNKLARAVGLLVLGAGVYGISWLMAKYADGPEGSHT